MDNNLLRNREHYNRLYKNTRVEAIIQKVQNHEAFLEDAVKTFTSWHGLYSGGFKTQLAGKRVLELGCGDGLNALIMDCLGAEVVAIDISDASQDLIEQANRLLGTCVEVLIGDFRCMSFQPQSFDFVVGKSFLHHLTLEIETAYLAKTAVVVKPWGEARFFEPAVNSRFLDAIRWMVPVPGRPSSLNRSAFHAYMQNNKHPQRDNSSLHFQRIGQEFFDEVHVTMIGSLERLCRLIPQGEFNKSYRRWAHAIEPRLPQWFRYAAARSQLIIYREPKPEPL